MAVRLFKLLASYVILLGFIGMSFLTLPPMAAMKGQPRSTLAQSGNVFLTKQADPQILALGQRVTYTLLITNNSPNTLNATLKDTLPEGLVLQRATIAETVSGDGQTITWSGELLPKSTKAIVYQAIPPSTSLPSERLENVATLQFGETTLEVAATITTLAPDLGVWGGFVNTLARLLVFFNSTLKGWGVPYSFGFAIILFTLTIRLITYPLNVQQIKSSRAMQALQPELKKLQEKYKDDKEKLGREQMKLWQEHGINPVMGCLPMLVQLPIWFALYRALIELSHEGLLYEGFLWIPSLAGPVVGMDRWPTWIFFWGPEFIGWGPALAYLVLPVLLVASQFYMQQMMTPPSTDPQQASMQQMMKFMPIMFGYFALVVPSGLSLYWFVSNGLMLLQQYVMQKSDPAPASPPLPEGAAPAGATAMPATVGPVDPIKNGKDKNAKSKRKSGRKR